MFSRWLDVTNLKLWTSCLAGYDEPLDTNCYTSRVSHVNFSRQDCCSDDISLNSDWVFIDARL